MLKRPWQCRPGLFRRPARCVGALRRAGDLAAHPPPEAHGRRRGCGLPGGRQGGDRCRPRPDQL